MAKTVITGLETASPGQQVEIMKLLAFGDISLAEAQAIIERKTMKAFGFSTDPIELQVVFWKKFYELEINPKDFILPPEREEFGWLMLRPAIPQGIAYAYDQTWELMSSLFSSGKWTNKPLSKVMNFDPKVEVGQVDRNYAVRFRDVIEADNCHRGKSANMIAEEGINGITLLWRMDLGIFFWWLSGGKKHLDFQSITLCTGSRDLDGCVPSVCFGPGYGQVFVDRYGPDDRGDYLRVREVVSDDRQVA